MVTFCLFGVILPHCTVMAKALVQSLDLLGPILLSSPFLLYDVPNVPEAANSLNRQQISALENP
jgi:hypothetical protein